MRTQSYHNFWHRLHNSAKNKGFPLRVMFELTYRCNFGCKHCYVPESYREKKGELKTKEVFSILDQLAEIGCFYLGFTGGEPFLRRDILDILWYAKKKGFEVIIYTNGSLIDEKIVLELSQLRPNKVDITIPAMSKDAFERISGLFGSRDKVFRAIGLLHKNRVNLGFKTCVLKENASEIKEIQDFAGSLDALHRLDDMLSPRLDGSGEPYKYRGTLKESSVAPPILHVSGNTPHASRHTLHATRFTLHADCNLDDTGLKQVDKNQSPINQLTNHQELFKCGVGKSQAAITPLGELKLCLMIDYPKYRILDTSLKDCWQRLRELVSSIKPDENYKCDECELQAYCKWCPAKSWLYNRSFTPLEKATDKVANGKDINADGGLMPPSAQTVRENSLTGFTSCEPESRKWVELRKEAQRLWEENQNLDRK